MTACAYGVMLFKAVQPSPAGQAGEHNLLAFMSDYGMWLLGGELVLLAATTIGAMATDSYWMRRGQERGEE
jgi:hypothetical protein